MAHREPLREIVIPFRFTNNRSERLPCWLEPAGDFVMVEPGSRLLVTIQGPEIWAGLDVAIDDDRVTVWQWTASIARVYVDDEEIRDWTWARAPSAPGQEYVEIDGRVFLKPPAD
ncbi:MAG: hypothetical protein U0556_01370 [Dehalococcoidia bacterium]